MVHLAFAYPSRHDLPEYREYIASVLRIASEIEDEYGRDDWDPLILEVNDDYPRSLAAYRLADVLLVNPIRDGMNLVAKEGPVLSERGCALVLSREAGAAAELGADALLVNPFDVSGTADALHQALTMSSSERLARCARLEQAATALPPRKWFTDQLAGPGLSTAPDPPPPGWELDNPCHRLVKYATCPGTGPLRLRRRESTAKRGRNGAEQCHHALRAIHHQVGCLGERRYLRRPAAHRHAGDAGRAKLAHSRERRQVTEIVSAEHDRPRKPFSDKAGKRRALVHARRPEFDHHPAGFLHQPRALGQRGQRGADQREGAVRVVGATRVHGEGTPFVLDPGAGVGASVREHGGQLRARLFQAAGGEGAVSTPDSQRSTP